MRFAETFWAIPRETGRSMAKRDSDRKKDKKNHEENEDYKNEDYTKQEAKGAPGKASASASLNSKIASRSASSAPSGHSLSFGAAPSAVLSKVVPAGAHPSVGSNAKVQSNKSSANLLRVSLGATVGAAMIAIFALL